MEMTRSKRRRVLQAALGLPLMQWQLAWPQTPGRTLSVAPSARPGAAAATSSSLLIAPRRALVIGNSSYAVGPLKNPANDAKAIAEELNKQGFEVSLGLDLKRAEMIDLIGAYGAQVTRTKPVALFYFAGHGLQLAWRNYLVPVDAAIKGADDVQKQCVDVNSVIEGIGKAANPMNMIILDACRDDPFGGSQQKGLSQLDAPPGTLLAFATSPGNVASDGDGANGLYTESLLREMKVPEAKIEDVFKRVRLAVRRGSRGQQIPWESTSLEEDFWFIPPKEIQKLAAAEAERVRKEKEAERLMQERIEKAQAAEAERLKKEAEAARARQEAEEKRRREHLEREYKAELERRRKQQDSERAFREELVVWQQAEKGKDPGPFEDYLRRYPSGRFTELAQLYLDRALAQQGEKKIEVINSPQNPYSQGTMTASTNYRLGDAYTYNMMDLYSRVVSETFTNTVTEITDRQVIYDGGRFVTDLLGNPLRLRDGREFSSSQYYPTEFKVGKRWSSRFTTTHPKFGNFETSIDFRIIGKERITVPAGTFDCFVIEGHGQASGQFLLSVRGLAWLAPDRVRRPVASEALRTVQSRTVAAERIELVKYQQS
jgi:uncharacterized caspase-like protein